MVKFFAYLCLTAMSVALTVLVMMKGWGLRPVSWWWILGGGVFGVTVLRMVFDALEKEIKEKK